MVRDTDVPTDRRKFLKYGGVVGLAALAGCAGTDDGTTTGTDTTTTGPGTTTDSGAAETFELNGLTGGWEGVAPDAIAGTTNPTLELEPGTTYRVVWTNGDGAPHDFVVLDDEGDRIVGTDIYNARGESHELVFEATAEMAEYYCSVHPSTMRGQIDAGGSQPPAEGVTLIEQGPSVGLEVAADGLASPTALVPAPGEQDTRYILDQPGVVYAHDDSGVSEFMDISEKVVQLQEGFDERGLLGMAFHPEFAEGTRKFYVRYSAPPDDDTPTDWDHRSILAEYETSADGTTGLVDSERILLDYPNPQFNHNGGPIAFGPDGYLYVGTGDGGNANDVGLGHVEDWYGENEGGNGQNTTENLLGGILRIDVDNRDAGMPYAIPADNPLVDMDGHRDEYYAWGFRNPWGMSFTDGGELLVADVGQDLLESVNHVEMGGNYSWNVKEGTHCFSTETPGNPPESCPSETPADVRGGEPLLDPIIEYPHRYDSQTVGTSIVGGELYRGSLDGLDNGYVFGDWSGQYAGRLLVAHAPDGWPEQTVPETDFLAQTDGHDSDIFQEERWEGLWSIDEVAVDAPDELTHEDAGDRLGVYVLGVERDQSGDLYVLTNESASPTGDGGRVLRVVPPE